MSRALLSGLATAALLPELVRARGGDAATCLHLGAAFALGTLASELPCALLPGRPSQWLARAGVVQALGLLGMALSPDLGSLFASVVLVGAGAGMCTGAEARASLAIGGDAPSIARLEVLSALGKAAACLAIAVIASMLRLSAEASVMLSVLLASTGVLLVRGLPAGEAHGRRRAVRDDPDAIVDRRRALSAGPVLLVLGVAALTLVARGTDPLDAWAITTRGGGLLACAALLAGKGLVSRFVAPTLARPRLRGAGLAALLVAIPLVLVVHLPSAWFLPIVGLGCGIAGGAAAAARGVLLSRLGSHRAGVVAALEATVRRVALATTALVLTPALHARGWLGPYAVTGLVAVLGAFAVVLPSVVRSNRATATA